MDGRQDRETVDRKKTSSRLRPGPEWIETPFDDLWIGDVVLAIVQCPFDDGTGQPAFRFDGVKRIPRQRGVIFEGRVVDNDIHGTPENLLIERTRLSECVDHRLIYRPILSSYARREFERRGAYLYRHRDLGPDRSTDDGYWLINRLRQEAGGDHTDPVAVERLAVCLAPPEKVGAEPAPLGLHHARRMLEGEHPYSEMVYRQIVEENARRQADPPVQSTAPGKPTKTRTKAARPKRTEPETANRIDEVGSERRERLGPYEGADAPLCLRFDTRPCWETLKTELGVTETGAAIVCDLYAEARTAGRSTSYSRTRATYASRQASQQKWQKRTSLATFDRILPQVDHLEAIGAITNWIAPRGGPGRRNRLFKARCVQRRFSSTRWTG